jgi:hypothetical protein
MKIQLKNNEVIPAIDFLQKMPLKSADSRHRTKFVKLLNAILPELQESERELVGEYCEKNEQGKPLVDADGKIRLVKETASEYRVEHAKLMAEIATIDSGQFAANIAELPRILQEYNGDLSNKEADIYDTLLDQFELNQD